MKYTVVARRWSASHPARLEDGPVLCVTDDLTIALAHVRGPYPDPEVRFTETGRSVCLWCGEREAETSLPTGWNPDRYGPDRGGPCSTPVCRECEERELAAD